MTEKIINLRDYLRMKFLDYRVEPSEGLWNNISDKMQAGNFIDPVPTNISELEEVFSDYTINPSEKVWQNITRILDSRKINFSRLLAGINEFVLKLGGKLSLKNSLAILAILILSFIPFIPNKLENKGYLLQGENSVRLNNNLNKFTSKQNENNKLNSVVALNNDKQKKQQSILNTFSNKQTPSKKIRPDKMTLTPSKLKTTGSNHLMPPDKNLVKESIYGNGIIKDKQQKKDNIFRTPINRGDIDYYSFPVREYVKLNQKIMTIDEDMEGKVDQLIDSFYKGWAKKFERNENPWYIEACLMPHFASAKILQSDNKVSVPEKINKEYLLSSPGTRIGINIGYIPRNTLFEAGLAYEGFRTMRDYRFIWHNLDTIVNIQKDSIGYIFNVIDSTYMTVFDYKYDTSYKTNKQVKDFSSKITYHLIELPIFVGYRFWMNKHSLLIKGGIIASFLVKTHEDLTTLDEYYSQFVEIPERRMLTWSIAAGLNYNYYVTDHLFLSVTPNLRYYLNSFYKDVPVRRETISLGLGFGVKYVF
jgi:hypothetical protein